MMDHMDLPPSGYHLPGPPLATSPDSAIDPSLIIDPAILGESSNGDKISSSQILPRPSSPAFTRKSQSEQGPQGDPFAPQRQQSVAIPERLPSPSRPNKRKRKTRPVARRDDECSFCQGDDARNKGGRAERMVSCVACGRSGHPSCLDIAGIANVLHSYPWHCIECKICEVCEKKGNGNRMLFCDACDRGWHMDCLEPPLEDTPDGSWVCPLCPPILTLPPENVGPSSSVPPRFTASPAPSVASSSQFVQNGHKSRLRTNGRGNRKSQEQLETEEGEPPRVRHKANSELHVANEGKGKAKGDIKGQVDVKGKGRAAEESHLSLKLPKLRVSMRGRSKEDSFSPDSPIRAARKVRLVVKRPTVLHDEDEEEDGDEPRHMFEGILTPQQHNTTNTAIHDSDRASFNRSRTRAELKLGPPVAPIFPSALFTPGNATPVASTPTTVQPSVGGLLHSLRTRQSVAQALHFQAALETPPGTPQPGITPNHLPGTPLPPRIRTIRFGEFDIDTWYDAPFPEEYASVSDGKLWMCEFCLKYMKSRFQSTRHRMKCKARHPPGDEIYRDGAISVFEVDGRKNKIYCQNLCLLSKMFLDHKSLFYDVEPFLFYVMTEVDRLGARFVGYFSKEKRSPKDYNVSCIMTLPVRQRRGWGNILIDFSYLLSKKENRVGSPERPLSALGALAYRQYWTHAVKLFLHTASDSVKLEDISRGTAMTLEDIYNIVQEQNMITVKEATPPPPARPPPGTPIKYLRGRKNGPGITRRSLTRTNTKDDVKTQPVMPTEYTIHWDREALGAYVTAWQAKEHVVIKPRCLKWSPFLLSREPKTQTKEAGENEPRGVVGEPVGSYTSELNHLSVSSTDVPQGAPLDVAPSKPKHDGESALLGLATAAEMQSPSLTSDGKDCKSLIPRSSSDGTSQAPENLERTSRPGLSSSPRSLRPRSGSLRGTSVEKAKWPISASENLSQRVLRSRSSVNNKRTRELDDEAVRNDTDDVPDLSQDGVLAAKLAQEESARPRRTRASTYKTNPPKLMTTRVSPRKRRRVESSTESESEAEPDTDESLSELTRTSGSPSPPAPRVTRARNGKLPNGTPRKIDNTSNASSRSTRSENQPLATGVRSSSRINGVIHQPVPSTLKRPAIVEAQNTRTRSTRRTRANSMPDDHDVEMAQSEQKLSEYVRKEVEEYGEGETDENTVSIRQPLTMTTDCVNGTGPGSGTLQNGTPALYDEDALGEEDAEGEEDPDPESGVEG